MPPRKAQTAMLNLVQLLPNLITLSAGCAGLTAIRFAIDGRVYISVLLILLAAVLDALDGLMARLLRSVSLLGAELDSLVDIVNFGVAPGLVLYLWALEGWRSSGWIAVLVFVICAALRLARFNVDTKSGKNADESGFRGVPAPGAALLVLLPLVLVRIWSGLAGGIMAPITAFWLVAVGLMMIVRFPTPSIKKLRIARENVSFFLIGLIVFGAALLTWPWPILLIFQLVYLTILGRAALNEYSTRKGP